MLNTLKDFNPIKFLNIDASTLSAQELEEMRNSLNNKIGEYILLKLSSLLTDEQFRQAVDSGEKIFDTFNNYIPDIDEKILHELENFKKDYQNIN